MSQNKETMVELECKTLGSARKFPVKQAEKLLGMEKNGGWKLPSKSKFEFVDNGIRVRSNTKDNKGASKDSDNTKGDKS